MYVYVSQWASTAGPFTSTVMMLQNGSPPGLDVTPTGTGAWEDTSSPVTVVANDDISHTLLTANTGSITLEIVSIQWTATNKKFHSVFGKAGSGLGSVAFGTTRFWPLGGGSVTPASTEANVKTQMQIAATITNLTTYVAVNTIVT